MNCSLYPPSAQIFFRRDDFPVSLGPRRGALFASGNDAAVTTTTNNNPSVSTAMCRLRPLTFLSPSNPTSPPTSVVFTLWLSPIAEMIVYGGMIRKIMRNHFPLTSSFIQVEQSIEDTACAYGPRRTDMR